VYRGKSERAWLPLVGHSTTEGLEFKSRAIGVSNSWWWSRSVSLSYR